MDALFRAAVQHPFQKVDRRADARRIVRGAKDEQVELRAEAVRKIVRPDEIVVRSQDHTVHITAGQVQRLLVLRERRLQDQGLFRMQRRHEPVDEVRGAVPAEHLLRQDPLPSGDGCPQCGAVRIRVPGKVVTGREVPQDRLHRSRHAQRADVRGEVQLSFPRRASVVEGADGHFIVHQIMIQSL